MSLDLSVLMKERFTKERLASLHAFLTKEGFLKEKIGTSSFFYFSTKPNISIDIYLTKAPMKGDDFWKNLYENGKSVHFPPKSAIAMESRGTEASHMKAYSLGKALARKFDGIIFDHQMSTAYTARGKPICEPGEDEESLRYGTPIGPFMETLALLIDGLQAGQLGKTPGRKKARKTVPTKNGLQGYRKDKG
jgi:hypothetical protein